MDNYEKHICVDILIFNKSGELALQKRSLNDKSFPGYWDFSAGGHIDSGEESQKAAERELFEELGINTPLTFIKREIFHYPSWNSDIIREVDADIYTGISDKKFKINFKEVSMISFFKLQEIQKKIDNGVKIHPEFILAWKKGVIS